MTLTTFNPFDLQIDRLFEDAVQAMGTVRPACAETGKTSANARKMGIVRIRIISVTSYKN